MRLNGKTVLVTGAGSGIGRALALHLAFEGAQVILVGRREDALDVTRNTFPVMSSGIVIPADITDDASRESLIAEVTRMGRLDLLINNAGVVEAAPVDGMEARARRQMVETNLLAPMELTLGLLPVMEATGSARIVNIGSMFGDIAFPFFAAYSATKFGLRGWSEALRRELAPRGIAVTYAAPRGTRTPATDGFSHLAEAFDMRLDTAEAVARLIVDAILQGRRDIYPRGAEHIFLLLQKLVPRLIDRALSAKAAVVSRASGPYHAAAGFGGDTIAFDNGKVGHADSVG